MMKTTSNEPEDGIEINKQARKRAEDRQKYINNAKRSKHICAHLANTNFEIPTSIISKMIELTDTQTSHSFFNGAQVRKRAMEKAKQIQAHRRDKRKKTTNKDPEM
eukprot:12452305-Heterocapsa_arctica.AAC.1